MQACRGVARGGAEEARAPFPGIWQIRPYSNQRGADYAPHTTASPPGSKKLSTSLRGGAIVTHILAEWKAPPGCGVTPHFYMPPTFKKLLTPLDAIIWFAAAVRRQCSGSAAAVRRQCGGSAAAVWRQCGNGSAVGRPQRGRFRKRTPTMRKTHLDK